MYKRKMEEKVFNNLEEVFESFSLEEQKRINRICKYYDLFFDSLCDSDIERYKEEIRIQEKYKDVSDTIGRYFNTGSIYREELSKENEDSLSDDELNVLCLEKGVSLIKSLLENNRSFKEDHIEYILEGMSDYLEKWDGTGNKGKKEGDISIYARMLRIVEDFDAISVNKHSETPVEFALDKLSEKAGVDYDLELVKFFCNLKSKVKGAFNSSIKQTRAIKPTLRFIRRTDKRPFELWYKELKGVESNLNPIFLSKIRFKNKEDWTEYEDEEEFIINEEFLDDLNTYMLLEACDTINRLNNCGISYDSVALEMPTGYFNKKGLWKETKQIFEETLIDVSKFTFILSRRTLKKRPQAFFDNIENLRKLGVKVLLDCNEKNSDIDTMLPTSVLTSVDSVENMLEKVKEKNLTLVVSYSKEKEIPFEYANLYLDIEEDDWLREDDLVGKKLEELENLA